MTRASDVDAPAPAGAGIFSTPGFEAVPPRSQPAALGPAAEPRHLLGLEHLSRDEILGVLDEAERHRVRMLADPTPTRDLAALTLVIALFEDSTRTRVSFEIAARRLGALVATFSSTGLSLSKGETLLDTMRIFAANGVDLAVVRHSAAGVPEFLSRQLSIGIVNAGDGAHEHPTQGLLDLMTLSQLWNGRFEGRRVAIVGDIAHSRVARSAIFGLTRLGAAVTVAGPATLMPFAIESLGVSVAETLDQAMVGADAVMALRLQRERMEQGLLPSLAEYARVWGVNAERVRLLKPDGVVMHPGPVNRGVELSPEVADCERSVILRQVENGLAVRCAVLMRCARALGRAA